MYNRKKAKISRRFGERIFPEVKISDTRLATPPGAQAGQRRRRGLSEYGRQLREKQKVKLVYGMREKQFRRVYDKALKDTEPTPTALLKILERRLDNAVYRAQMGITRDQARQLVSHGHILVNGQKVTIPSYSVSEGDVISFADTKSKLVAERKESIKEAEIADWLSYDKKKGTVTVSHQPVVDELGKGFNLALVVEFYSR